MMLSGCWVALPSDGPPGAKEHIGHVNKLQRDILIVSYWLTPISWEVDNQNSIGSNQEIRATLEAGNEIKILSIKSFRLPSGIHHSFRCIDLKSKRKFDLSFSMLDCIGLANNLIIQDKNFPFE